MKTLLHTWVPLLTIPSGRKFIAPFISGGGTHPLSLFPASVWESSRFRELLRFSFKEFLWLHFVFLCVCLSMCLSLCLKNKLCSSGLTFPTAEFSNHGIFLEGELGVVRWYLGSEVGNPFKPTCPAVPHDRAPEESHWPQIAWLGLLWNKLSYGHKTVPSTNQLGHLVVATQACSMQPSAAVRVVSWRETTIPYWAVGDRRYKSPLLSRWASRTG